MADALSESWLAIVENALISGKPLIGDFDSSGGPREVIPAEVILQALARKEGVAHPAGLDLYNVVIAGKLDLRNANISCKLSMRSCVFEQRIDAESASLQSLDLVGSSFPGLDLDGARTTGDLDISYTTCTGSLSVARAHIAGTMFAYNARIMGSEPFVAFFNSTHFGGDVILTGSEFIGGLRFIGAQLDGILDLDNSVLRATDAPALDLDHAAIRQRLDLQGVRSRGEIRLRRLRLDGELFADHLSVSNYFGASIDAQGAEFGSGINFHGLEAVGPILFSQAKIKGDMVFSGANVGSLDTSTRALSISNTEIRGDLIVRACLFRGTIYGPGAHINSNFALTRSTVSSPYSQAAVFLNRAVIAGNTKITKSTIEGQMVCQGTHFGGEVSILETEIKGPRTGGGCDFFSSTFDYSLILDRVGLQGGLQLGEASISKFVSLLNLRIDCWHGTAIEADSMQVGSSVAFRRADIRGSLSFISCSIEGELHMAGIKICASDPTINLNALRVDTLYLHQVGDRRCALAINKINVDTLVLMNKKSGQMPMLAGARDIRINGLAGFLTERPRQLHAWLSTLRQPRPAGVPEQVSGRQSQPWHEVARALQASGRSAEARWFHVKAADQVTANSSWTATPIRLAYRALAAYGYRPWYVLAWMVALWLTAFFLTLYCGSQFAPTNPSLASLFQEQYGRVPNSNSEIQSTASALGYIEFSPFLYSFELLTPLPQLGQVAAWRPDAASMLTVALTLIRGVSWILSALLLASATGLLRKI